MTPARLVVARFDVRRFPWAEVVGRACFGAPDLPRLHLTAAAGRRRRGQARDTTAADNLAFRARLAGLPPDAEFFRLYHAFAGGVVAPLFGGRISYTSRPTFRVHMPGTQAISLWHRDADVTGRLDQINVWTPFTPVAGANSLWIEQHYGAQDYAPVTLGYGEFLCFDGGLLAHGSVENTTTTTRVSMDFRFAPLTHDDGVDLGILQARPAAPPPPQDTEAA